LPKEIGNLLNLTEFDSVYNKLALSQEDVQWLDYLIAKECSVNM